MLSTYSRRPRTCTGNSAEVSQLRLPLFRDVSDATGLLTPNSTATEKARRFLVRHVPSGTVRDLAETLDAKPSRISREIEGRALLSVDAFAGFAAAMSYEDRLRLFAHVLAPFGFQPVPASVRALDDSAVG